MTDEKLKDPAAPKGDTLLTGRGPRPGEQEAAAARGASDDVDDEGLTTALGELLWKKSRGSELVEYAWAYLAMARAGHRPVEDDERPCDPGRLHLDAVVYARAFSDDEDACPHWFNHSDRRVDRAFVWAIEAARSLMRGGEGDGRAVALMRMAIERIEEAKKAE